LKYILVLSLLITLPVSGAEKAKRKLILEKTPKSLFLIKKAKINADVAEPQFYPMEAQLRTVINDPLLHNAKKFE